MGIHRCLGGEDKEGQFLQQTLPSSLITNNPELLIQGPTRAPPPQLLSVFFSTLPQPTAGGSPGEPTHFQLPKPTLFRGGNETLAGQLGVLLATDHLPSSPVCTPVAMWVTEGPPGLAFSSSLFLRGWFCHQLPPNGKQPSSKALKSLKT